MCCVCIVQCVHTPMCVVCIVCCVTQFACSVQFENTMRYAIWNPENVCQSREDAVKPYNLEVVQLSYASLLCLYYMP